MHACRHTYIHPSIHSFIHSFIHTYIHTYPSIHTYISIHPSMHACIHTYMHTYIHAYMHTCIHTYIHTHIYTYTLEYIFHTHCTLLIHMKHGETALEHHRARLRKRHKSRCPRYTSSTVCPRCLMMFFFLQTSKFGDEVQDKVCMLWNCRKLQPFHHRTAIISKPRWNWRCPNSQKVGVKSRGLDCSHLFHFILIILFFLLWRSTRIYMLWWAGTSKLWERNCSRWKPEPAAELLNFLN